MSAGRMTSWRRQDNVKYRGKLVGYLFVLVLTSLVALPASVSATELPPEEGGQDVEQQMGQEEGSADNQADCVGSAELVEVMEKWGALIMSAVFFSGGSVCGVLAGGQFFDYFRKC